MANETIAELIMRHEGLRLFPYIDTVGKVTIGVGRNLTDCGLSREEVMMCLSHDIGASEADLNELIVVWQHLNEARRFALIDMRFNLGPVRFRGFKRMLVAVDNGDFQLAAQEMRESVWYRQVGRRGEELAHMVETGLGVFRADIA